MNHMVYPHQYSFPTLSRYPTSASQFNAQPAAPTIASKMSFPRASSIIPLARKARAGSHRLSRANSAPESSKKRTFREFALGEEVEVAREDVEMVDA